MKKTAQMIIGWREYVDLPEWGIHGIRAKIDTGARTSALHVEEIKLLEDDFISFYVVLNKEGSRRKKVTAKRIKKGKVKSSTGIQTERWYVQTEMKLGQMTRDVIFTLTSRPEMNFRLLIGRRALEDDFIVDVGHSFLLGKTRKGKKGKVV